MEQLRELHFDDLNAAIDEARSLLRSGYDRSGNWSLGQICRHLVLVQDPSVDGYPKWMSLFAFLRPAMRRILLPKVVSGDSPRGIRTASMFVPPVELDDVREVDAFAASVARFYAHLGDYAPHPAFERLPRERIEQIHTAHAAHHLRFLKPRD
ncbi:hypothetical protein FHS27_000688 [Rhodopirellula rubra]|uniref:DUF1569 domain-containing protein n=1 Tax=Aporhodopirellula rubra TaxID=980271 RepID=A0A7W5H4K3_9BACT|nr:DUF1569 domain-containing protein [Aporhodopirellula rubra]MBB3204921.1 hypothetical protein [Aporhodopirellula rubra]